MVCSPNVKVYGVLPPSLYHRCSGLHFSDSTTYLPAKAETECGHSFCRGCILDLLKSSPRQGFAKCPYCRQVVSVFDVMCGGSTLCERLNTIFGGVYVHGNTEGLPSYHFEEAGSYICLFCSAILKRKKRKPFENSSYDPETRTFRGIVN